MMDSDNEDPSVVDLVAMCTACHAAAHGVESELIR